MNESETTEMVVSGACPYCGSMNTDQQVSVNIEHGFKDPKVITFCGDCGRGSIVNLFFIKDAQAFNGWMDSVRTQKKGEQRHE